MNDADSTLIGATAHHFRGVVVRVARIDLRRVRSFDLMLRYIAVIVIGSIGELTARLLADPDGSSSRRPTTTRIAHCPGGTA